MTISNLYKIDQRLRDECLENALDIYYKNSTVGNFELIRDVLNYMKPSEKCKFKNFVHAVGQGNFNLVTMFEDRGVDTFSDNGKAFKLAVLKGHTEIIKFFLLKGADVSIIDNEIIQHNIKRGRTKVIEILREYGANI